MLVHLFFNYLEYEILGRYKNTCLSINGHLCGQSIYSFTETSRFPLALRNFAPTWLHEIRTLDRQNIWLNGECFI